MNVSPLTDGIRIRVYFNMHSIIIIYVRKHLYLSIFTVDTINEIRVLNKKYIRRHTKKNHISDPFGSMEKNKNVFT